MRKRLLSLFCALSLLLTLLPTSAFAVEDGAKGTTAQAGDTEVVTTAPEETELVSLTADELDDPYEGLSGDDLLMGYLYSISGLEPEIELPETYAALPQLTGIEQTIYTSLADSIEKIANGTKADTDLKILLGSKPDNLDDIISAAEKVVNRLLVEKPYALYWCDHITASSGGIGVGYSSDGNGTFAIVKLPVAKDYAKEGGKSESVTVKINGVEQSLTRHLEADIEKTKAAANTAQNAQKVVSDCKETENYNILRHYFEYIIKEVDYDYEAIKDTYVPAHGYGNPWQIINVFDESADTKVVCEGYAKAFKYLCDLTKANTSTGAKFTGTVDCSLVSGTMSYPDETAENKIGSGPHMWNIVSIDNNNYLVDVTNCDGDPKPTAESTGGTTPTGKVIREQLFLYGGAPETGTTDTYKVTLDAAGDYIQYKYDAETLNAYNAGTLTLATESCPNPKTSVTITKPTEPLTCEYGAKLGSINLDGFKATAGESTEVTGTFAWADDVKETIPNVSDSQKTEYTVKFTPTGENADKYAETTIKVKVTVKPKTITPVITLPADATYTYNGEAHQPTVTVKAGTDTDAADLKLNTDYTVEYGENINAGENAGSVTVKPVVGSNYTFAEKRETFTIAKANAVITVAEGDKSIVKNGVEVDITNWATVTKGLTLKYELEKAEGSAPAGITLENGKLKAEPTTTVTEFTIKVAAAETTNYNAPAEQTITVKVKDKEDAVVSITGNPANNTVTYGDQPFTLTANAEHTDTDGAWVWTSSDPEVLAITSGADAATVTIKKASADPVTLTAKYTGTTYAGEAKVEITVNAKALTGDMVTLNPTELPYNGNSQTVAVTVKDGETNLVLNTDYDVSGLQGTEADTYPVTVTGQGNYTGTISKEWKITKADPDIGTVSKTAPDTIYPHTTLDSIKLTGTGTTEGKLELTAGQTLTVGTKGYNWTFTPTDKNYNVVKGEIELTVAADKLKSIKTEGSLEKSSYTWGEEFSLKGITVKAVYESGAEVDVTKDVSYIKTLTVGQQTVEISYEGQTCTVNITVNKADAPKLADINVMLKVGTTGEQSKEIGTAGMPADAGKLTYAKGDVTGATLENLSWDLDTTGTAKVTFQLTKTEGTAAGQTATLPVKITSANYAEATVKVVITLTDKDVPTVTPPTVISGLVYNGQEQALITAGTVPDGCKMLYKVGTDDGKWTDSIPTGKNAANYVVSYKVVGNEQYANVDPMTLPSVAIAQKKVTIRPKSYTITKGSAIPTFELVYTGLVSGESLTPNEVPAFSCVEADGSTAVSTSTAAGTYTITWTNKDATTFADADNYDVTKMATANLTISNPSSSGGGSISGSGTVKTDTVTNPDGSVTKTETKRDGTVIETTTGKDGSVSKTTTNPNGSSVTETKAADGSMGTVKTDERGQTTAQTTLSSKAIETAKRNGEPVKAPVEVNATRDSSTAPTVKIELPRNSGDTNVEIPVTNVKPGTVAVLVHPDGTEEIVKSSLPTEDGIQLTVNGGATVKIVDNSKDFIDIRAHWAKDAIDFVSARGLVDGMNAVSYAPDASTTRAQLWTILARQNDADLSGGTNWYEKAQLWSKDKGISDGTEPNAAINRAQMVTMLWRTMGQPAAGGAANFNDVPANSYYAQAVAWAVENGITAGVGGGRFDPNATCTRAQIAAFLARSMK